MTLSCFFVTAPTRPARKSVTPTTYSDLIVVLFLKYSDGIVICHKSVIPCYLCQFCPTRAIRPFAGQSYIFNIKTMRASQYPSHMLFSKCNLVTNDNEKRNNTVTTGGSINGLK